jgi:hypothetical protein
LTELDALILGQFYQLPVATTRQSGVAGVSDGLGHQSGIDDGDFQAVRGNDTRILAQGNAHCQKLTGTVFANAMTGPNHGGSIHGESVLEDHFAAEGLPVRVLHPAIQNITIR